MSALGPFPGMGWMADVDRRLDSESSCGFPLSVKCREVWSYATEAITTLSQREEPSMPTCATKEMLASAHLCRYHAWTDYANANDANPTFPSFIPNSNMNSVTEDPLK